jgi:hypothetical protein
MGRHAEIINQRLAFGTWLEPHYQHKVTPLASDCYIHLS